MDYKIYLLITTLLILLAETYCSKHDSCSQDGGDRSEPTVTAPSGRFRGLLMTSRRGRKINAFRGIRFVEPPIGELRFEPPRLIERYTSEVDATEEGPFCPQLNDIPSEMSEDCIHLSVYSPNLSQHHGKVRPLPVLVFFHPGGFYAGTGRSSFAGPEYLLDHDIVLVSINYRIGAFGFISTGDKYAPGNLGLKDQVASLRWIQQNIAAFGGDPGAVTICGYSAGGISVGLHMLSPMSKGLFHRVISMSGSPIGKDEAPPHQMDLVQKQARIVGCPDRNSRDIINCLKTKNATEMGNSLKQFYEFGQDPVSLWKPVVEPDLGQERFLTEQPLTLIRSGKMYNVPLIVGMTDHEFAGLAFTVLQNDTLRSEMDSNWERVAPISLVYERDTKRSAHISRELRRAYLGDRRLENDNGTILALGLLYGDSIVACRVHSYANLMAQYSKSPVYYYLFNYTGDTSFYYPGTRQPIGPVHHDDLIYLFNISGFFPPIELDSPHSLIVDKVTTLWTNFVKSGNPNPTEEQPLLSDLHWPTMTPEKRQFLQINRDFTVQDHLFEQRLKIWDDLFPL